jgi:hypothetical protein
VLYDGDGNAIDFSKTVIDSVPANGGTVVAPFTWPVSHNGQVVSIEVLPVLRKSKCAIIEIKVLNAALKF